MPPKPKYTKEQIVAAACDIAREKGIDAVAAREVAKQLGTSPSPIFTVFSTMEDLKDAVRQSALAEFNRRAKECLQYAPAFKQFGRMLIAFASEEPKLFHLLFLKEHEEYHSFLDMIPDLGEFFDICMTVIRQDYDVSEEEAQIIFRQLWLYCFGIAVLCANKVFTFSEEELNRMMGQQFVGVLLMIKSGKMEVRTPIPEKRETMPADYSVLRDLEAHGFAMGRQPASAEEA